MAVMDEMWSYATKKSEAIIGILSLKKYSG